MATDLGEGRGVVRVLTRIVLIVVALETIPLALWGLFSPRGVFDNFPGGGRHWVRALPPYNEHLLRDYAGALLGIGVLVVWAAVTMDRRIVQAALVTVAAATVPHAIYHATTTSHFSTLDNILSDGGLWVEALVPILLLVAQRWPAQVTGAT